MTVLSALLTLSLWLPANLREALTLYDDGDLPAATAKLEQLATEPGLDVEARLKTYKYLGACRHIQGDPQGADQAFISLLKLDPTATLDPVQFPPDLVSHFELLKASHRPEAPTHGKHLMVALGPFGLGQFQNDAQALGMSLAIAQGLALAVGVGGLLAFEAEKTSGGFLQGGEFEDPDKADQLQATYLAGFGVFAGLWALGAIEAVVHLDDAQVSAMPLPSGGAALVGTIAF